MPNWFEQHFEQGRQKGRLEGRAEGQAEYVLRSLAARGVHVDEKSRQRILSCTDVATLDRWFEQALKATRLSEVLEDLTQ
jgi:predicted transposase YdaD